MPHFVVVQSKADYDREQREKAEYYLRLLWVILKSGLMAVPVFFFMPAYAWHAVMLFVALHLIQRFSKNPIKSYIGAFFVIPYAITGIILVITSILSIAIPGVFEGALFLFVIGVALLYFAYKNTQKYTNLLSFRIR